MLEPGFGLDVDNPGCRHAVKHGRPWILYNQNADEVAEGTEAEAIAWCLDGTLPTP